MGKKQTPLEKHIIGLFHSTGKERKMWKDLESFGTKLPSGGHMWTGGDLIRYFESRKKRKSRKRKR